ncbi:MAG: hypothetical protein JJT78_05130 [Leptospira sp.]|nr:hypothetical protein [Leptospira sp.]
MHRIFYFYPESLEYTRLVSIFKFYSLYIAILFYSGCSNAIVDTFSADDAVPEKTIREELFAIAAVKCIETGGDSLKLLEAYIFVDKQFSKSSGSQSQRDRITYKKKDAENCRNNLLIYPVEKCDFKPFDFYNYLADKAFCKLEPTSFFQ